MKKDQNLLELFKEVSQSKNYHLLERFHDTSTWAGMTEEEKKYLSELYFQQGIELIKVNFPQSVECFDLAQMLVPKDYEMLQVIARVWIEQLPNEHGQREASKNYQKYTTRVPDSFSAWFEWAEILFSLGVMTDESHTLIEAVEKFAYAYQLAKKQGIAYPLELLWHWGLCWNYLSKHSEEAVDVRKALEKYNQAADEGLTHPLFYCDLAQSFARLGSMIGKDEYFLQALEFYKKGIQGSPQYYLARFEIACVYDHLYEAYGLDDYFTQAEAYFLSAARLNTSHYLLWLKWGEMLAREGRLKNDHELMVSCLEKFEKSDALQPNHPQILTRWAEALTCLGSKEERLDLLQEAKEKISQSLLIAPDEVDSWWVYGHALSELGHYFDHTDHFYEAIKQFECGLVIDEKHSVLWSGIATAYFAISEIKNDPTLLEKSVYYCAKAIENGAEDQPQCWNDWGVALMKLAELKNDTRILISACEKFEQGIARRKNKPLGSVYGDAELFYNYGCALDFLGDYHEEPSYYEKAVGVLAQVVHIAPEYSDARYHFALALTHLGVMTGEVEFLQRAVENFYILLREDHEDEVTWNDCGITLLSLAQMLHDPIVPHHSQAMFEEAESKFMHALSLGHRQANYNLACLFSVMGNFPEAMHYLLRARDMDQLPPIEELMQDEWLDGIRPTIGFQSFINQLSQP